MDCFSWDFGESSVTWVLQALVSNLSCLVVISRMYIWYFVWRGRDFIIPSLIKEHYAFPNIVVSKGSYVDYSHRQTVGV